MNAIPYVSIGDIDADTLGGYEIVVPVTISVSPANNLYLSVQAQSEDSAALSASANGTAA
jgi:hypothetical protein